LLLARVGEAAERRQPPLGCP